MRAKPSSSCTRLGLGLESGLGLGLGLELGLGLGLGLEPSSSCTRLIVRILSSLHSWMTAWPVGRSAPFWMSVSPGRRSPGQG